MQSLLFSFQGRVNRAKYWLVGIGAGIVYVILMGILTAVTGGSMTPDASGNMPSVGGGPIGIIISLILLVVLVWVSLAIAVKRWHDRNKSGWWVLINFVPVIGGLWQLIECGFLKGTTGQNQYGTDPLAAG